MYKRPFRATRWSKLGFSFAVIPVSILAFLSACGGDDVGPTPDGGLTLDGGSPSPFSGFSFGGAVNAAVHAGNSWYIGGDFQAAQALPAPHLLAIDASGSASAGCDLGAGFDGPVSASVVIGSSLYVGGEFTHYKGASANYIAKLDRATCALDTTFSPPASNGFNQPVRALVASGDGNVFAGGLFGSYRGKLSERGIAKLDAASGDLNTTFSPADANGVDLFVNALAVSGEALFIGGRFSNYRGTPALSIAKVNIATGVPDTTFTPPGEFGFTGEVYALATSGASVYAGGNFGGYRGYAVRNFAKLDVATGDVDPSTLEAPSFDKPVHTLLVSGSSIYVGGAFTRYGIASANGVAKLGLATNALDTTFSPPGETRNGIRPGSVHSLALFDGALYVGGEFALHQNKTTSTSVGSIVKVDLATGALLSTLTPPGHDLPGVDGAVLTMAAADDGLYVGGLFHGAGGRRVNGLVKVDDATFEVDTTFSPPGASGFDGPVYALVASGSSLYVGGAFSRYRDVDNSARNLAKLDLTTGEIDTSFSAPGPMENGTNGPVYALASSGNALFVGGGFTGYRFYPEGRTGLVKLDLSTGAPDATFSPEGGGVSGGERTIYALALSGTSLFAAGNFTDYFGGTGNPGPANSIVKVDAATGTRDTTFSPDLRPENGFTAPFPATVSALAVGNGALYVGGNFFAYRSTEPILAIAKLDPTSGVLDTTFSPATNGFAGEVLALAVEGSSVYVGGNLARYRDAFDVTNVAKLDGTSGALDMAFAPISGPSMEPIASVRTIVPNGSTLLVGGDFGYYGGAKRVASAAFVDPATGALK